MQPLLDPSGGYRKLDAFLLASLIQLETRRFCDRFLNLSNDPKGRQFDQMTQAARSGRANIMEGSQRSATSKTPWPSSSPQSQAVAGWRLEPHGEWTDPLHDSGIYLLAQRKRLAEFLDADESTAANTLLVLCRRAVAMLTHLLKRQGEMFTEKGGFRERMKENRLAVRDGNAPACPKCGRPMRRRVAKSGPNQGRPFWGCSGWPDCDGRMDAASSAP